MLLWPSSVIGMLCQTSFMSFQVCLLKNRVNILLTDCWLEPKGSNFEGQIPSLVCVSLRSWVMSRYPNKGPVTSSHRLNIPRLYDCDLSKNLTAAWWAADAQTAWERNGRRKLTEKEDWTELFAFSFVTKGRRRVKLGRRAACGCSIWLIWSHVPRRWGASSPARACMRPEQIKH